LIGRRLPSIALASTDGTVVYPAALTGSNVFFCYPYTGRPGVPDPPGWDDIPGAHGSTPQALAYSALHDGFDRIGARAFGVSFDDHEWQKEFAQRNALRVPLLSDAAGRFAAALELQTFRAGAREFLQRVTLIASDGRITAMRSRIADPAADAAEVLAAITRLP
jgi:peroxiredoxin